MAPGTIQVSSINCQASVDIFVRLSYLTVLYYLLVVFKGDTKAALFVIKTLDRICLKARRPIMSDRSDDHSGRSSNNVSAFRANAQKADVAPVRRIPCTPNRNDVLVAKGDWIKQHPGNIQLKGIMKDAAKVYEMAGGQLTAEQQAKSCLNLLRNMQPRGRFLVPAPDYDETKAWHEMSKCTTCLTFKSAIPEF